MGSLPGKLATVITLAGVWLCALPVFAFALRYGSFSRDECLILSVGFVVFSALLPLIYYARFIVPMGDERLRTGMCVRCGYDLRGTPARCPECGDVPNYARIDRTE